MTLAIALYKQNNIIGSRSWGSGIKNQLGQHVCSTLSQTPASGVLTGSSSSSTVSSEAQNDMSRAQASSLSCGKRRGLAEGGGGGQYHAHPASQLEARRQRSTHNDKHSYAQTCIQAPSFGNFTHYVCACVRCGAVRYGAVRCGGECRGYAVRWVCGTFGHT